MLHLPHLREMPDRLREYSFPVDVSTPYKVGYDIFWQNLGSEDIFLNKILIICPKMEKINTFLLPRCPPLFAWRGPSWRPVCSVVKLQQQHWAWRTRRCCRPRTRRWATSWRGQEDLWWGRSHYGCPTSPLLQLRSQSPRTCRQTANIMSKIIRWTCLFLHIQATSIILHCFKLFL